MPRLERQTGKLQKNHFAQQNFDSRHVLSKRKPPSRMLKKVVQQGRSTRRGDAYSFGAGGL